MSRRFPRAFLRVPVALADFLAQIVQHNTTVRPHSALWAVTQTFCGCREFGKQNRRCDATRVVKSGEGNGGHNWGYVGGYGTVRDTIVNSQGVVSLRQQPAEPETGCHDFQ